MIARRAFLAFGAALPMVAIADSAQDPRIAANPALRRLAAGKDADLDMILTELDRILIAPRKPLTRSGGLTDRERRLIFENTLIGEAYQRDAKATQKLIRVIIPKLDGD